MCERSGASGAAGVLRRRPGAAARGAGRRRARPAGRGARAFTLVELLVVIAIIALLVSILMPSLSRAKELVRISACLSNLHQLGVAGHAYYAAYNCFPPEHPGIMGAAPPVEAWPRTFLRYAKTPNVFNCASIPAWMKWDGRAFEQSYGATPFSYGLDVWGMGDNQYNAWWTPTGRPMPGRTMLEINCPEDFYWLSDSNGGLEEDPLGMWDLVTEIHLYDWCPPWELPGARHLGGTCMLFADDHSQWIPYDDILKAERLPTGSPERIQWRRRANVDHKPHEELTN